MAAPDTSLSERLAARVRDLRVRAGMTQPQLAAAAREHGAGESFSEVVVGHLESGRRREGRRTRLFTLDELLPLASALEVSPLELLGEDSAQLFVGESGAARFVCPDCSAEPGPLERAVREDLAGLDDLATLEPTLVETAFRLAKAIDAGEDARALPALTKELRATVESLAASRRRGEKPPDDEDFGDLDDPD
jgi:transcriptional regulator with XRE-family HTH domain